MSTKLLESTEAKIIKNLRELGLTATEAKIYLALAYLGSASAGDLEKRTGIQRPHVYKALNKLEKRGLIEREISTPTIYRAEFPEKTLATLIAQKKMETIKLEKNLQLLLRQIKLHRKSAQILGLKDNEYRFTIITGLSNIIGKLKEALGETTQTLEVVTIASRFSSATLEFADEYEKALRRGVKIRICVEEHKPYEKAAKIIEKLAENPNLIIRYVKETPETIVAIYDGKQAFVALSTEAHTPDVKSLWSNHPNFVTLAHAYFETKWRMADEIKK